MRIIAGKWRGKRLAAVGTGDKAAHLRPTSDRVRENIFNMLAGGAYGTPIAGARVLDLFAGTGALGLEALSRGASFATFVDDGKTAHRLLQQNLDLCDARVLAQRVRRDASRLGQCNFDPFDLIFLDPPYGKGIGERALLSAAEGGWLLPGALIMLEEGSAVAAPAGFRPSDQRRYGDTFVHFFEYQPEA